MKKRQSLLVQAQALYRIDTALLLKSESGTKTPFSHFWHLGKHSSCILFTPLR
jgi:hypothetical protein